ncbi:transcriptional regulator [Bradyrhizobium sp. Gha]|uniref:helix-turn-helix domain-containing transcriptional regulator n=1 Tax=Bradyrhizobium sp. Gha TaxID=1855318 RepID=UPI0008E58769|nr:transcriptional regulator [Bradyrhizobium sp. Gha]SFJ86665.1 probable addiction module antidote protein [Bradyrhizobium sp. Gha]
MLTSNKAILGELFRDNPAAIASYLTEKMSENDLDAARTGLSLVMQAQNVQMLARDAGLRRDTLYKTFGGRIDPHLSRILKLYDALNVRAGVVPANPSDGLTRPSSMIADASNSFAEQLTKALAGNCFNEAVLALREVAFSQNVSALARASAIQRRTIYKTFGGTVDPQLSRILKLFKAMQLRFVVVPLLPRSRPPRPKLGRPLKASGT